MRKLILFLFMTCFCSVVSYATGQRHKTIEFTFQPTDFVISEQNGLLSIDSYKYAIQYGSNASEPALPLILFHVLIGGDEDFAGINISYHDVLSSKGVQVQCNPTYAPRTLISQTPPRITPENYSKGCYPSEYVKYTGTHNVDGYRYISFFVSPFVFLTQEKELFLHEKVVLDIQLEQKTKNEARAGRAMRNAIKSIIINKDDMAKMYPEPKREMTRTGLAPEDEFDYLIITRDSLKDAFQKLADWKTRRGVPTRIITMEHIDTTFAEPNNHLQIHTPLSVKKGIKHYYCYNHIKYVLIGGDDDMIPAELCYVEHPDVTPYPYHNAASDLYYACLNHPIDWDYYNHNYTFAEYDDLIDMHPVVAVSRLSVSSNYDAQNQIKRIIDYERGPGVNEWNNKYLSVGCAIDTLNLFDGLTDVCKKGQKYKDSLEHYISETFMLYDSLTSHTNNANYDVTPEHFKEQLENGYSFIQFDGHGDFDCFKIERPYYFYNQDAYDFSNPVYSMIVTSACKTNGFNFNSLSESFMRNPQGKIIAYWGGTLETIGHVPECGLTDLDYINLYIYKYLFEDSVYNLGDAVNAVRLKFITEGNMPYTNAYRWNLLSLNLLGDPEMPIYTKAPMEFEGLDINIINDEQLYFGFANDNNDFSYFDICIMSLEDNGESFYTIIPHVAIGTVLNLPPGHDYSVCATQPGFKPFLLNVYRRGFVQNDTIANESLVWSNQAMIGRDVTTTKPQGPVVVEKDQMTIKAPNGVTIKNNFTLKKGASLVIDPTIQYISHSNNE